MKHQRRTSLKIALASGLSLARWSTPSIVAVSLPAHADMSLCDPADPPIFDFTTENAQCVVGTPNRITFDLVNTRLNEVTFKGLDLSEGIRTHISPPLPFELAPNESVSVVVESELNSVADCPDLQFFAYLIDDHLGCGGVANLQPFLP